MLSQFVANGIVSASEYAMFGISFVFVYRFCKRFDVSVAAAGTVAAYTALNVVPYRGVAIGLAMGAIAAGMTGLLLQLAVFRQVSSGKGTGFGGLLASLGLYTIIVNILSLVFGDNRRSLRIWPVTEGHDILGARLTTVQLSIIASAIVITALAWLFLRFSRPGKALRAMASDPELAMSAGLDTPFLSGLAMVLSAVAAGSGALLLACDVDMTPGMGLYPYIMGVVAAIIGGLNVVGTLAGAILLGVAQHVGVIWMPTQWQDAVAFFILLAFLLFGSAELRRKKSKTAEK